MKTNIQLLIHIYIFYTFHTWDRKILVFIFWETIFKFQGKLRIKKKQISENEFPVEHFRNTFVDMQNLFYKHLMHFRFLAEYYGMWVHICHIIYDVEFISLTYEKSFMYVQRFSSFLVQKVLVKVMMVLDIKYVSKCL